MTSLDISATRTSGGKLAKVPSCCATRTSLERMEMAMPTHIDQPASSGVNSSWVSRWELSKTAEATAGRANKRAQARRMQKDAVGDAEGRNKCRERRAYQEFLGSDRGDQDWFEGSLLAFADNGEGREC
jgi:hypothetical protein